MIQLSVPKVVPVLDTAAYAANDVLFLSVPIPGLYRSGKIKYITLIDKDDVGEACVLYFFKSNVSLGVLNAAASITDANTDELIGITATITAGTDLVGVRVGFLAVDIPFETAASGIIYVGGLTTTALTHTASGITLNIGIENWG